MSGICGIEFSEASNVKVLVENVRGKKGMWQEGGGDILGIFKCTSPRTDNMLQGITELVVLGWKKCAWILLLN